MQNNSISGGESKPGEPGALGKEGEKGEKDIFV